MNCHKKKPHKMEALYFQIQNPGTLDYNQFFISTCFDNRYLVMNIPPLPLSV